MANRSALSPAILQAALQGLELQKALVEQHISAIRSRLDRRGPGRPSAAAPQSASTSESSRPQRKRRTLSAAARKSIAEAQKKRWAEFHKRKKTAAD